MRKILKIALIMPVILILVAGFVQSAACNDDGRCDYKIISVQDNKDRNLDYSGSDYFLQVDKVLKSDRTANIRINGISYQVSEKDVIEDFNDEILIYYISTSDDDTYYVSFIFGETQSNCDDCSADELCPSLLYDSGKEYVVDSCRKGNYGGICFSWYNQVYKGCASSMDDCYIDDVSRSASYIYCEFSNYEQSTANDVTDKTDEKQTSNNSVVNDTQEDGVLDDDSNESHDVSYDDSKDQTDGQTQSIAVPEEKKEGLFSRFINWLRSFFS